MKMEGVLIQRVLNSSPLPPGEDGARFARQVRAPASSSMRAPSPVRDTSVARTTSPEGRGNSQPPAKLRKALPYSERRQTDDARDGGCYRVLDAGGGANFALGQLMQSGVKK